MDQLKQYLKIALQYRFWILVGIASVLPLIAYAVGGPALKTQEKQERDKIEAALKDVEQFSSGDKPTAAYKKVVEDKKAILEKDVNATWRTLYERQAPLLTWPEEVQSTMQEWGDQWPEKVDIQRVNQTIIDYTYVYKPFVEQVYKSFKPFDPETGEGIVVAPPSDFLLQPFSFEVRSGTIPTLGKVWNAQRKLWVQRTILDVIAKVNQKAGAKDWSTAAIKQILDLQVANDSAIDMRSLAKGVALEDAPEIVAPGTEAPAATATATAASSYMGGKAGGEDVMRGQLGAGAGPGGGFGGSAASEVVRYLASPNPDQYYVVPFSLSVLMVQERIPDLIVEFRNSPMSIQVLDFEMVRPTVAVRKPRKGQVLAAGMGGGYPGMGGMGRAFSGMGRMGRMGSEGRMAGMGGMGAGYPGMGGSGYPGMGGSSSQQQMMMGATGMAMRGGMGGLGAGADTGPRGRQGGVDVSQKNLQADREKRMTKEKPKEEENLEEQDEETSAQLYYDVVEVHITGQARFYKMPPKPADEPASPGDASTEAADAAAQQGALPAATAETPAAGESQPGASPAPAPSAEPKPETASPAGEPAPSAEPAQPENTPPAEPPAGEPPKPDSTPPAQPGSGEVPPQDAPPNPPETPKAEPPGSPPPPPGAS
jgi:hypothetical protein